MNLEIMAIIAWIGFSVYGIWYLVRAKTDQPITLDELVIQWKLHKQKTGCQKKDELKIIKRKNKILGFQCSCGYQYHQKRLISQRIEKQKLNYNSKPKTYF